MSCSGVRKRAQVVRMADVAAIVRGNVFHGYQAKLAGRCSLFGVGPAATVAQSGGISDCGQEVHTAGWQQAHGNTGLTEAGRVFQI